MINSVETTVFDNYVEAVTILALKRTQKCTTWGKHTQNVLHWKKTKNEKIPPPELVWLKWARGGFSFFACPYDIHVGKIN